MKIYILIEYSIADEDQNIINVFTDEELANKYFVSFTENQPNYKYFLQEIDTTEELPNVE